MQPVDLRRRRDARSILWPTHSLFGSDDSAALAHADKLAAYAANGCWFHLFDELCISAPALTLLDLCDHVQQLKRRANGEGRSLQIVGGNLGAARRPIEPYA